MNKCENYMSFSLLLFFIVASKCLINYAIKCQVFYNENCIKWKKLYIKKVKIFSLWHIIYNKVRKEILPTHIMVHKLKPLENETFLKWYATSLLNDAWLYKRNCILQQTCWIHFMQILLNNFHELATRYEAWKMNSY